MLNLMKTKPSTVDDAIAGLIAAAGRLSLVAEQQNEEISRQKIYKSEANFKIAQATIELTRANRIAAKLSEIIE